MSTLRSLFRGRAAAPLRQYQLHEHLALMDTGVRKFDAPQSLRDACEEAARLAWPLSGLKPWEAHPRVTDFCYACGDGVHGYLHFGADHANCFMIVICELRTERPVGWLLFDIGAEYHHALYVCPDIDFEGEPTEHVIADSLPRLRDDADSWAVLDRGNGTYMQAYSTDGGYVLEHQLVTPACHYRAVGLLDAQQVIWAFNSYAFKVKEWARELRWERVELPAS
jgi:hypothetical protein